MIWNSTAPMLCNLKEILTNLAKMKLERHKNEAINATRCQVQNSSAPVEGLWVFAMQISESCLNHYLRETIRVKIKISG